MERDSEKLWNSNYLKVWFAHFLLYFSFMLLTPLFPLYLSETFDADKQMIGVVLSGYTLSALFVRPFSGYLVDSFSRKKVLLVSFFFFFILFIGYPISTSLMIFAVVRTLHGLPFGAATVANSTVAIDVLPSSRRAEGIGYYGLSNNVATAIAPTIALLVYDATNNYDLLFTLAIIVAALSLWCNCTVKTASRPPVERPPLSLDRFILLKAWRQIICMICFGFSYGVISTYVAIYGKEELGIAGGSGMFFMLLAIGLILSRLSGGRSLRQGRIAHNATLGMVVSLFGYLLFAAVHSPWGYYGAALIFGLGNGHMFPAFQTMFVNLASNEQRGTANSTHFVSWDTGVGLGVLLGGMVAEHYGYHAAFWVMWIANFIGVAFYLLFAKKQLFEKQIEIIEAN